MNGDGKLLWVSVVGVITGVLTVSLLHLNGRINGDKVDLFIVMVVLLVAIIVQVIIITLARLRVEREDKYDKNIKKLNRLISYNKQRDEIEQEIGKLSQELMTSDISQYIDLNRLVFSGQNCGLISGSINYSNFLKQFGIQEQAVSVKKGTAVFLTPFNRDGEELFVFCQTVLGRINIFLRKTDNLVEKDDILMNIVSLLVQSEFVIANLNGRNTNVYYELGIAHAIGKPTILLSKTRYNSEDIGFDIRQKRIILYDNLDELEKGLLGQISMLKQDRIL